MNAGRNYAQALKQAQANADLFQRAYVVHGWGVPTEWHVERLDSFSNHVPEGATVVNPKGSRMGDSTNG